MSRLGAGFGAFTGVVLGGTAGAAVSTIPTKRRRSQDEQINTMLASTLIGSVAGAVTGAALGAGPGAAPSPGTVGAPLLQNEGSMTPAQAYGHPDFVTDVPVQGPTDEGLRKADCKWAQTVLPAQPACADCRGPIPMWAQRTGLSGTKIALNGRPTRGFALAAAGDPDIWQLLTPAQQSWLATVKQKLNDFITKTTGTTCKTWGPDVTSEGATKCFQNWYNSYGLDQVRTDGVLDLDTLNAFIAAANAHASDGFPQFPGTPPAPPAAKKISTAGMVGIAAAGATALGGLAWLVSRGGKKKGRRRSRR